MRKSVLAAGLLSFTALASTAHATQREEGLAIPRCTQNIGTVVIVEAQKDMFGAMDMAPPAALLRHLVRESGCFTLIQRAPGGAAPVAPRMPEFALAANLTNEIKLGDGRTGVLGVVGRNRATRYVANAALESATGGMMNMNRLEEGIDMAHDGRLDAAIEAAAEVGVMATGAVVAGAGAVLEETANSADSYNRAYAASGYSDPRQNMEMAAATGTTRVAGRTLSSAGRAMMERPDPEATRAMEESMGRFGLSQQSTGDMINQMPGARLLGFGGRKSDEEILRDAMEDLKKDLGRGKTDAMIEMSLVSLPLGEVVGEMSDTANRDEVRRRRISNNNFNGRVGRGWEDSDEGKAIALAITKSYTELVTQLGGMGSTTPEITVATREAVRKAEEDRIRREEAEAARNRRPEPRTASRPEPSRRVAAKSNQPAQAEVIRNAILRDAPAGRVITQLTAGATVYPTGEVDDIWREVEDDDGNTGWVQEDRLMDLD